MWILLALACSPSAPVPSLEAERSALRAEEQRRLWQASRAALDEGELHNAATAIVAGLELDEPRFRPLSTELDALLEHAEPRLAATVHAALYEASRDPGSRARHRAAATDALVRSRYASDEEIAITRREQQGVTRARAQAAVRALREEYVTPLDDRALLRAAVHRLSLLDAEAPSEVPPGAFTESFDALIDRGIELGLPEELVAAELAEAVFESADTWSSPIWPAQIAAWEKHHDGVVSGIVGLRVEPVEGEIRVAELIEGGSAWAAGVHQGDRFVELRAEAGTLDLRDPASAPTAEAVAAALRGPNGTVIPVTLERNGVEKIFLLERGNIAAPTVAGWRHDGTGWQTQIEPGIHFVHIASFKPTTLAQLDTVLSSSPSPGLILDLRGNTGGDLASAVKFADRFVESGTLLQLQARQGEPESTPASPGDPWEGTRLVVLIDRSSASSAEIVAGALQQSAAAKVVGESSAGKGVSQVLRVDAENGIALQFTNLIWALPDGRRIHRTDDAKSWGIQPDVEVPLTSTERFAVGVMQAQREALRVHADGSPMAYRGPEIDPNLPQLSADPQIEAALKLLR